MLTMLIKAILDWLAAFLGVQVAKVKDSKEAADVHEATRKEREQREKVNAASVDDIASALDRLSDRK